MTDIFGDTTRAEMQQEITLLRAEVAQRTAERDALAAEVAALKPQSNANNSAPIPLKEWVIEVFQHLCHSPHTPDEWKRDLDKKTIALLDAIEQGKEGQR
jgi:chorismate mutase